MFGWKDKLEALQRQVDTLDEIVRNHGGNHSVQTRLVNVENEVKHLKGVLEEFAERDIPVIRETMARINERNKTWGTLTLEIIAGFLAGVLTIIITGAINGQQPRNNVHQTGVQPNVFPILSRMRSS